MTCDHAYGDELGVFARSFRRNTPEAVADAIRSVGFEVVQLNLNCFGLPTIPDERTLDGLDLVAIGRAFIDRGIAIWGVSLTYNMIHPDVAARTRSTADAARFLTRIAELGASFATVCTGTRDATDMWRRHPANADDSAWKDLRASLDGLLPAAAQAGLRLGVEPERANVIADAAKAARLFAELGRDAPLLGVVLDPANLVEVDTAPQQRRILSEAFAQLRQEVVCVHAKDVVFSGYAAAGLGLLDYDLILELRQSLPRTVPVIVQDVTEEDSGRVRDMLLDHLERHPMPRERR